MTIDLKTLSEMPSAEGWRLKLSKRPRRSTTSTTVVAVGSPLTDPNGVKEGRYSYSRTGGIDPTETTSEHTGVPSDTSKTISSIKESNPMTRREELETKGISQLMAERFAEGVPTGAFTKNVNAARAGLMELQSRPRRGVQMTTLKQDNPGPKNEPIYSPEQYEALRNITKKYGFAIPEESMDGWLRFFTDPENEDSINLISGRGLKATEHTPQHNQPVYVNPFLNPEYTDEPPEQRR